MKKFLLLLGAAGLLANTSTYAQRLCGAEILKNAIIAQNPGFDAKLQTQKASLKNIAVAQKEANAAMADARITTTTFYPVPVIFHFIIDSAQLAEIGGEAGIVQRIDSQIMVLNRDYNRGNDDSAEILTGFKPRYSNVGIHFGLAAKTPGGVTCPGYELTIISGDGFSGAGNSYKAAKSTATGGVDSWDVTRYLNVWCINFTDISGLLGITEPESFVGGGDGMTEANKGIAVSYKAVGKRALSTDAFPAGIDLGRTLTHEFGHFFEIWHTWGDDGGSCPGFGGDDDGIQDTPPQATSTFGTHTLPIYDACKDSSGVDLQPYGIMYMNYMDYSNDNSMHMFTIDQANVMYYQVQPGNESYSLTQQPGLSFYPPGTTDTVAGLGPTVPEGVTEINKESFSVSPNPTSGIANITLDLKDTELQQIDVINMLGQTVLHKNINGAQNYIYSIDISAMSKGIYFVRCTFATGSITKKIMLQ